MNAQEKNYKESMICLRPKPRQIYFVLRIQNKKKKIKLNNFFKERGKWKIEQKNEK